MSKTRQAINWNNGDTDPWRHMSPLCHNVLMNVRMKCPSTQNIMCTRNHTIFIYKTRHSLKKVMLFYQCRLCFQSGHIAILVGVISNLNLSGTSFSSRRTPSQWPIFRRLIIKRPNQAEVWPFCRAFSPTYKTTVIWQILWEFATTWICSFEIVLQHIYI